MGHDATIVINMDAVDQIQKDPEFGKKVYDACCTIAGSVWDQVSESCFQVPGLNRQELYEAAIGLGMVELPPED